MIIIIIMPTTETLERPHNFFPLCLGSRVGSLPFFSHFVPLVMNSGPFLGVCSLFVWLFIVSILSLYRVCVCVCVSWSLHKCPLLNLVSFDCKEKSHSPLKDIMKLFNRTNKFYGFTNRTYRSEAQTIGFFVNGQMKKEAHTCERRRNIVTSFVVWFFLAVSPPLHNHSARKQYARANRRIEIPRNIRTNK